MKNGHKGLDEEELELVLLNRKYKYKCDCCGTELFFFDDTYVCNSCGLVHQELRSGRYDTYITSDMLKQETKELTVKELLDGYYKMGDTLTKKVQNMLWYKSGKKKLRDLVNAYGYQLEFAYKDDIDWTCYKLVKP